MTELITAETTKEQVDEVYRHYPSTKATVEDKPFYESRLAPIFYEIRFGSKVLDVGANDGSFIKLLKDKRGCDVTGIDISEVAVEEAKKNGLNVQLGDIENLPFEDGTFDYVTCMEVLSHLFSPEKALREIKRVLKPNGILLGSCPHKNLESYAWEDKRLHRRYFDETQLHETLGVFYRSFIKVLTGIEFAFALSNSFLSDQPAEMLFKCGGELTQAWDEALRDKSILRCWFGFTQSPGTVYYRMSGYADKMQLLGAQTHYNPYDEMDEHSPAEWVRKIVYLPNERRLTNAHIVKELEAVLKAADLSVFQVTSSRHILLILTTARKGVVKKPLLTELDDWIFDLPSYNVASGSYHPNSEAEDVAYEQLKLSDAVICSTEYIKEKLNELLPGKPVYIIKNSIDFDVWDNLKHENKAHQQNHALIRIGFSGCGSHSGDLDIIKRPMMKLLDEFPNLEFLSLPYPSTEGINHERYKRVLQWVSISAFPQAFADWEIDIGIAPLRDNNFNRAKSNLRWLEYSASKIPTIASDVEPFKKSIEHKKTGFLVKNSETEWYGALKALIVDERERTEMGLRAYQKVKKDYNMEKVARTYLSVLKIIKRESFRHLGRVR